MNAQMWAVLATLFVSGVVADSCQASTLLSQPPGSGTYVALKEFSYCAGSLSATAYIANLDYNKVVTLYYTNGLNQSTPRSSVELNYVSSIGSSGYWQYWSTNTPLFSGITELLNITYIAQDIGETYSEQLLAPVNATGSPAPDRYPIPKPYATFDGFERDISEFLGLSSTGRSPPGRSPPGRSPPGASPPGPPPPGPLPPGISPPGPYNSEVPTPPGSASTCPGSPTAASQNLTEPEICMVNMFRNINPNITGDYPGTVVAGRCGPSYPQTIPNYEYNWVRDSSLTFNVVESLYSAATTPEIKQKYENLLFEYAKARATEQTDPGLATVDGLGEPKFYLNDTIFTGPWCRPQTDGPATSAITLIEFANDYLDNGGNSTIAKEMIYDSTSFPAYAPVKRDLLFVATNWTLPTCDLWEEVYAQAQFYDRMVQRKALILGAAFAQRMGDPTTSSILTTAAADLTKTLPGFWDPARQIILYENGPVDDGKILYLDSAIILGVIHGYADDGIYSYTNEQVLATAVRLATSFLSVYPLANITKDTAGMYMGIPIGRFPTDTYDGSGSIPNGGNPWYLCTAAFAQFFYTASMEYGAAGKLVITNTSKPFFDYFAPSTNLEVGRVYQAGSPEYQATLSAINGWGDAFIRRIKAEIPSDGHLHEEYNRNTGEPQGCADLSWSYASVLSAAFARAKLRNEPSYIRELANQGF